MFNLFQYIQRDFEPITGAMWRDVTRYQLNVAVDNHAIGKIQRSRKLSLAYVGQPLPVYWVEKSSTINADGVEDFYSRVCWVSVILQRVGESAMYRWSII